MLNRIKGEIMMYSKHQNKYDSVLKIQFGNNEGMGKGGRRVNSHLP